MKLDFSITGFEKGEYESCTFHSCNFSEVDLTRIVFVDCLFVDCNLSLVKTTNLVLRRVQFKGCKMLGFHFEHCNGLLLSVGFEKCMLNLSTFYRLSLKKTKFVDCALQEVDFTECDLTDSKFDGCDLSMAIFRSTNLEKADFRSSYNYAIDPGFNTIKKAKFSLSGLPGLLDQYDLEIE